MADKRNSEIGKGFTKAFDYMMLGRMESDIKYYLGNGNLNKKYLHQGDIESHIEAMKEIYNKLEDKPEWLTMEQINNYHKDMLKEEAQMRYKAKTATLETAEKDANELGWKLIDFKSFTHPDDNHLAVVLCKRPEGDYCTCIHNADIGGYHYGHYDFKTYESARNDFDKR